MDLTLKVWRQKNAKAKGHFETCSLYINGRAHGPDDEVTTCQLHMRKFHDGDTITIEPWRSAAFPVIKDLVVNRQAFDQILQAGGFISVLLPASVAVPALPLARTVRPCCSLRQG